MTATTTPSKMIHFAPVARLCREQTQYASCYLDGTHGAANLGEGLRYVLGKNGNYHDTQIHVDDVLEFVTRYANHLVACYSIDETTGAAMIEAARTWTPNPRDFA